MIPAPGYDDRIITEFMKVFCPGFCPVTTGQIRRRKKICEYQNFLQDALCF
jgi:hypothetical protein